MAFFAQNKAIFCKNLVITLVFVKNANIFAENWEKLQKMVIIQSTPDFLNFCNLGKFVIIATTVGPILRL
jgi:hypothetical protein